MKTWSPKQPARLFAQAKLDGHWLSVERVSMSTVRCLTRTPTELDLAWVPSLKNAWSRLPIGQTLHGELWVPGRRASQVKSCLARRDVSVRFTAFSVATMASHAPLSLVNEMCALWGFDFAPWWWTREHATVEQHLTHAQDAMLDLGHSHRCAEGVVFKDGNTMNEVKYKPTRTMDLVVTGVKDAALTSKNLGLVGSITGAVWTSEWLVDEPVLIDVADVSGMTDDERLEASTVGEQGLLGRVMEVGYQYVGDGGKLRHPRFVRWREDKRGIECAADQDDELTEIIERRTRARAQETRR